MVGSHPDRCPELIAANEILFHRTRRAIEPSLRKMARMEELVLSGGRRAASEPLRSQVLRAGRGLRLKYLLASAHLEELWTFSLDSRMRLVELIEPPEVSRWDSLEQLIGIKSLEGCLLQTRAFLDFFMYYACLLFGIPNPGKMSQDKFAKKMSRAADPPLIEKASALRSYFASKVFGDAAWGNLLCGLRDRIAHLDGLHPSREGEERVGSTKLDWPTIRGMTFERLAQEFQNGCFELIRESSPLLFDVEWKSGPYDEHAWDE